MNPNPYNILVAAHPSISTVIRGAVASPEQMRFAHEVMRNTPLWTWPLGYTDVKQWLLDQANKIERAEQVRAAKKAAEEEAEKVRRAEAAKNLEFAALVSSIWNGSDLTCEQAVMQALRHHTVVPL